MGLGCIDGFLFAAERFGDCLYFLGFIQRLESRILKRYTGALQVLSMK